MSIHYENGYLKQAVTRGNGIQGDDVTPNIKTIRSLPLKVKDVYVDGALLSDFEVRGEVYIADDDFIKINERQEEQSLKLYANARNLAAGTIKLLNPSEVAKRPLKIICYYLFSQQIKLTSQSDNVRLLKELGFPVSYISERCSNIDDV
jgi:DNA ligase (NAD+)